MRAHLHEDLPGFRGGFWDMAHVEVLAGPFPILDEDCAHAHHFPLWVGGFLVRCDRTPEESLLWWEEVGGGRLAQQRRKNVISRTGVVAGGKAM